MNQPAIYPARCHCYLSFSSVFKLPQLSEIRCMNSFFHQCLMSLDELYWKQNQDLVLTWTCSFLLRPLLDPIFDGFVSSAENSAFLTDGKPKKGKSKEVDAEAKPASFNESYQEAKVKIFSGFKSTV